MTYDTALRRWRLVPRSYIDILLLGGSASLDFGDALKGILSDINNGRMLPRTFNGVGKIEMPFERGESEKEIDCPDSTKPLRSPVSYKGGTR